MNLNVLDLWFNLFPLHASYTLFVTNSYDFYLKGFKIKHKKISGRFI